MKCPSMSELRLLLGPVSLFVLAALSFLLAAGAAEARPQNLQDLAAINKRLTETGTSLGAIPSLYRPRYDRVQDAALTMSPDDIVFVVLLPDGPRLYPQRIMVWHQVVNEVVDDMAFAITYSPTTGSLMAYDATLNGINLIFDVDGRLYDGNSVLIDRTTNSLWLQELGIAFDGQLLGRGLPMLPVFWTSWEAARRVYPQAPVLAQPPGKRPYGRDPYGDYRRKDSYYHNDRLAWPVQHLDKRFHRKTNMLCLEYGDLLLAIDVEYVKQKGVVNFFLGSSALLATHDPQLDVVRVFSRHIWAEPFLFVLQDGRLMDLTTRSIWDPASGKALEGNMQGATMQQFFGCHSMWFAWYSIHPETFTVPGPGDVPAHLLSLSPPGEDMPAAPASPIPPLPAASGLPALPGQAIQ